MISFATLLLGLVTGSNWISLSVSGPVAAAVIELDGMPAAWIDGPPWGARVDLGPALIPHELVARALDKEGREMGRARQLLNVPRPASEVQILLERDPAGGVVSARLSWQSLLGSRPKRVQATFDGKQIEVDEKSRVVFPSYDWSSPHLFSVRVDFSSSTGKYTASSRADAIVGGQSQGTVESELTALPVRFRNGRPWPVERLQGLVLQNGNPLRVVAVERGPGELWIVRDTGSEEAGRKLAGGPYKAAFLSRSRNPSHLSDVQLRFVWPMAKRYKGEEVSSDLFDTSQVLRVGLYRALTGVSHPEGHLPSQRFSDAAAVAGLQALQGGTRRAVLLVLGSDASDISRFSPQQVRRYLREVRVPLYVWALGDPAGPRVVDWGKADDVSTPPGFEQAVRRLRDDLASQSIVWVAGRHLPHSLSLAASAEGVEPLE